MKYMIEEFDQGKYYLYRHIRLDNNEVFYVGIGTNRYNCYRALSLENRNKYWNSIVKKNSGNFEVEILLESNNLEFIKQKEIEFIDLYGRRDLKKGTLCNLTDGGDGIKNPSLETRKKLRDAKLGKPMHENAKKSLMKYQEENGNPFLGKHHSQKTKEILRIKSSNRSVSEEQKEKYRLTVVPREKRDEIVRLLNNGKDYKYIVKELNTSTVVILKVKKEYGIQDRYDFYTIEREDGLKFYTEAEACRFIGVTKGNINKCIKKGCKSKGYYWFKINNHESKNKEKS